MRKVFIGAALLWLLILPVYGEMTAPPVPEAGAKLMPQETKSFSQGLRQILEELLPLLRPELTRGLTTGVALTGLCLLLALLPEETGGTADLAGAAAIAALLLGNAHSMIRMASETVTQMSEYEKLLLPVVTAAMAAQGGVNAATALYAGSAFFNTVLSTLLGKLLLPVQYLFLGAATAGAALGNDTLKALKNGIRDMILWCMRTLLSLFTAYLGITGVVTGATDAALTKAAKMAISAAIPIVGGILSDASEAVLVGAGVLRSSLGIYGILAILAVFLEPFGRIGVQYLILKGAGLLCALFGRKKSVELIGDFGEVMRMLLAITGGLCLLLMVSSVCFLKGVG